MARQSSHRRNAEQPEADQQPTADQQPEADLDTAEEAGKANTEPTGDAPDTGTNRELWDEARVHPIELALPSGVGYTLRAYRLSTDVSPTEVEDREEDDDPFASRLRDAEMEDADLLDEEFDEQPPQSAGKRRGADLDDDTDGADDTGADGTGAEADSEPAEDEEQDEDEDEEQPAAEEIPVFLTHRGRLLLFKTPESLVAFIRSGAPHDLTQLETWSQLAERVEPSDVSASDEDSYELDLVVENLRGGHDAWDFPLVINAGEIARDLGYALRLQPVITALAPGSPLDDLDEALRAAESGGFAGFRGRRRLRRIGAQQASLGWRTIIGKISAAVDWRD